MAIAGTRGDFLDFSSSRAATSFGDDGNVLALVSNFATPERDLSPVRLGPPDTRAISTFDAAERSVVFNLSP